MGSWGTAIFSDDVAADVRADWRDWILDRVPPEELTAKLINSYAAQADDPDDGVVFWLALAAAQHETGRLRPDVRDTALDILDHQAERPASTLPASPRPTTARLTVATPRKFGSCNGRVVLS